MAGEAPGRESQNQFVEPQQIAFGGSGPWEGWRLGGRAFRVVGRLEAGEAADKESKINLLRLNKLILVVPGRGKAGGWGKLILDSLSAASPASSLATARNHQNQFVEPQQIDFGFPACCLPSLQPCHGPEPPKPIC